MKKINPKTVFTTSMKKDNMKEKILLLKEKFPYVTNIDSNYNKRLNAKND